MATTVTRAFRTSCAAIIAAAAMLVGACGTASTPPVADPVLSGVRYVGAIAETVVYANAGITLDPPSTVATGVTWQEAIATCGSGGAICPGEAPATLSLAVATTTQSGEARADGSIEPLVNHKLAYVLTYLDVPCAPAGGVAPPGASPDPGPSQRLCVTINLIDAQSGKVLYSAESPAL